MADIRCVSNHAEEIVLSNGEVRSVAVGEIARSVDLSNNNNQRLINEARILVLLDEKKKTRTGDDK